MNYITDEIVVLGKTIRFNDLIWISSYFDDEGAKNATGRLTEFARELCAVNRIGFRHVIVGGSADLSSFFYKFAYEILMSRRVPILHLDFHGSKSLGLQINNGDFLSWDKVIYFLRILNQITSNNLVVVGAACEAYWAIKGGISIENASPFYVFIAPESPINYGVLELKLQSFYLELLENYDLPKAVNLLIPEFKDFHCERVLFVSMCKYIAEHCRGKGGRERKEDLLTKIMVNGASISDLGSNRKKIRGLLTPNQETLERFSKKFLMGDSCSFGIEDIYKLID